MRAASCRAASSFATAVLDTGAADSGGCNPAPIALAAGAAVGSSAAWLVHGLGGTAGGTASEPGGATTHELGKEAALEWHATAWYWGGAERGMAYEYGDGCGACNSGCCGGRGGGHRTGTCMGGCMGGCIGGCMGGGQVGMLKPGSGPSDPPGLSIWGTCW